ncbi:MAG: DNA polymerase III subunit delta' [Caldilineaceae bacterium]|nr:DNA polymerase III subunit delta' [Caldilineaceae bacterium]
MAEGSVVGHQWAVQLLQNGIRHDRLRHAYLFVGAAQVGKSTLARSFAQSLLCQTGIDGQACGSCRACRLMQSGSHPDFMLLPPTDRNGEPDRENGLHRAEQAGDIVRQALLHPMEGRYKVFLIQDAHRAHISFANKLLKTLEEPPPHVVLCLTALDRSALLPTIVSRCQVLALRPLGEQVMEEALLARWGASAQQAALLARLANGCLGWAVDQIEQPEPLSERSERLAELQELSRSSRVDRLAFAQKLAAARNQTRLFTLLALWMSWWRDIMLAQSGCLEQCANIDLLDTLADAASTFRPVDVQAYLRTLGRIEGYLRHTVNTGLALDVLLLQMPRPHA